MKLKNQKTDQRFPSYSYSAMSIEQFNVEDTQILFSDRKKNRCIEKCSFLSSLSRVWEVFWKKCCWCRREKIYLPRSVYIGQHSTTQKFPPNVIRNQKYNIFTFIPVLLFEQFRVFLNLCFLIMALSQFVPSLRIGYLYTYWGPLGFVLFVTFCREAVDDIRRWKRDREVNSARYTLIVPLDKQKPRQGTLSGPYNSSGHQGDASEGRSTKPSFRGSRAPMLQRRKIASSEIKVGDVIIVEKDQRVPADLLLLRTSEKNGACFIRTDQLDGETDWKLRLAVQATRTLERDDDLFNVMGYAYVEAPRKDIYNFEGNYHQTTPPSISRLSHKAQLSNASAQLVLTHQTSLQAQISSGDGLAGASDAAANESLPIPLTVENTLWSNTVVASGPVVGLVIYTGSETRSVMNSSQPRSKVGLTDRDINHLTILLTLTAFILALVMISFKVMLEPGTNTFGDSFCYSPTSFLWHYE
jgi:phospholipid-translocating ATPase